MMSFEQCTFVIGRSEVRCDELVETLRPFLVTFDVRNRVFTLWIGRAGPHEAMVDRLEMPELDVVGGGYLAVDGGFLLIGGEAAKFDGLPHEALELFREPFLLWFEKRERDVKDLLLLKVERVHPFWRRGSA